MLSDRVVNGVYKPGPPCTPKFLQIGLESHTIDKINTTKRYSRQIYYYCNMYFFVHKFS